MTTKEGNKLIAEFLGWKPKVRFHHLMQQEVNEWDRDLIELDYNDGYIRIGEELFHSDWNWLMFVVKKIEKIGETDTCYGILCDITSVYIRIGNVLLDLKLEDYTTKKDGVWLAVVKFIEQYNENSSTT